MHTDSGAHTHRQVSQSTAFQRKLFSILLLCSERAKKNVKMDTSELVQPVADFYADSRRLLNKCSKPDAKEFRKIAFATFIGFCIMGGIGFFVKLIHIPINNIIVGA